MKRRYILLIFSFLSYPAVAIDLEILKSLTGEWVLETEGSKNNCVLKLKIEETIGGYAVEEKKCPAPHAFHDHVAAWNFDDEGKLIFLDAERKVLLKMDEMEDATYRTALGVKPIITLQPFAK